MKSNIIISLLQYNVCSSQSTQTVIVRQINSAADKYNKDGEFTAMVITITMIVTYFSKKDLFPHRALLS